MRPPEDPPEPGRGRIPRLLLFLAVIVASGIGTVWEHVRAVRAGYRLHALEAQRERLTEERRRLEIKKAREERLDVLERRAKDLGIPNPALAPPVEGVGG
jgi:cell division protein FtsL